MKYLILVIAMFFALLIGEQNGYNAGYKWGYQTGQKDKTCPKLEENAIDD